MQVSRDKNLKIPKTVEEYEKIVTVDDIVAVKKGVSIANNKKFDKLKETSQAEEIDKELETVLKIPFNSNDLIVVTVVKKLCAYVIAITEKSPKKYRSVFVNRMQNYCLDALEYLINANFIRMDNAINKQKREDFQKEAIIKLKLLSYISMVSESCGCILKKQYKQISIQGAHAINLIVAWKKSDDERWKKN